jgi:hypothetical protein
MKSCYIIFFFSFLILLSSCDNTITGEEQSVQIQIDTTDNIERKEIRRSYKDSSFVTMTSINILNQEEYINNSSLVIEKEGGNTFAKYKNTSWGIDSMNAEGKEKKYQYTGYFDLEEQDFLSSNNNNKINLVVILNSDAYISYAKSKEMMRYFMSDVQNAFDVPGSEINRSDSTSFGKFAYSLSKSTEGAYGQNINWSDSHAAPNYLIYQGDTLRLSLRGVWGFSNPETTFLPHTYK